MLLGQRRKKGPEGLNNNNNKIYVSIFLIYLYTCTYITSVEELHMLKLKAAFHPNKRTHWCISFSDFFFSTVRLFLCWGRWNRDYSLRNIFKDDAKAFGNLKPPYHHKSPWTWISSLPLLFPLPIVSESNICQPILWMEPLHEELLWKLYDHWANYIPLSVSFPYK